MADLTGMTMEQLMAMKSQHEGTIKTARAALIPICEELDRRGKVEQAQRLLKRIGPDGVRAVQTLTPDQIASAEKVMTPG